MAASKRVAFKVGTGFRVPMAYTPTEGRAPDTLEDVTITSEIRTPDGTLIATLTPTKSVDFMSVTLSADDGTRDWPIDTLVEWDVLFDHEDFPAFYTETIELQLVRNVTGRRAAIPAP